MTTRRVTSPPVVACLGDAVAVAGWASTPGLYPMYDSGALLSGRAASLGLPGPITDDLAVSWTERADRAAKWNFMTPGYRCPVVTRDQAAPIDHAALIRGIVDEARDRAVDLVAFLYVDPEQQPLLDALRRAGFQSAPLLASWRTTVTWRTWPEYLGLLASKVAREVGRELRRLESSGVEIDVEPFPDDIDELVHARVALRRRHGTTVEFADQAAEIRAAHDLFGDDLVLVVARRDARFEGFTAFLHHQGLLHALWTGTSAQADPARSRFVYFATTYYAPARLAGEKGIGVLDYGPGTGRAKRQRGARPVVLEGWFLSPTGRLGDTVEAATATLRHAPPVEA